MCPECVPFYHPVGAPYEVRALGKMNILFIVSSVCTILALIQRSLRGWGSRKKITIYFLTLCPQCIYFLEHHNDYIYPRELISIGSYCMEFKKRDV